MYRRPKNLDSRITDELYDKLMDIASAESEAFYAFGGVQDHFERAVLQAAKLMLPEKAPANRLEDHQADPWRALEDMEPD